jgi:hypothetical protein
MMTWIFEPVGKITDGCKFSVCVGDDVSEAEEKLKSRGFVFVQQNGKSRYYIEEIRRSATIVLNSEDQKVSAIAWRVEFLSI